MNTPTFFSDFDGVWNFFGTRSFLKKRKDVFGYLKKTDVWDGTNWYSLNYSSDLVNKINNLKATTGFKWVWHSTWLDKTALVDSKLGTNSDGYLDWDAWGGLTSDVKVSYNNGVKIVFLVSDDVLDDIRDTRKYAALLATLKDNPVPFVWVDDTATRKYNPADFVGVLDVPHLVLTTNANTGMNHDDYAKIVDFFTKYSVL